MTVNGNCTPGAVYRENANVHLVYMAGKAPKKVTPRPKRPQYQRTYIKQWRDHRKLTQEQLAERVSFYLAERGLAKGYTYATIGRLERGLVRYTQPIMEAIADALRTDVASLLMRDPTDPDAIWTLWERAKPAQRAEIAEIAEVVLKRAAAK